MGRAVNILLNGKKFKVEVLETSATSVRFLLNNRAFLVEQPHEISEEQTSSQKPDLKNNSLPPPLTKGKNIIAPIPGTIVAVLTTPGASVTAGQIVMRLEAMKMENNIVAPENGIIKEIHVKEREEIKEGQLLISFT